MGIETSWPSSGVTSLKTYSSIEEGINRSTLRAPFEAGYEQTRAKWTRSRRSFVLNWDRLEEASFTTLLYFFDRTVKGGTTSFVWTHPSGVTYECRFAEDELAMTSNVSGYYSGSVRLRQV